MAMLRIVLLVEVILQLIHTAISKQPVFITAPQSVNVSEGEDTLFNCSGFTDGQFWLINGVGPSHAAHNHRNIDTHSRVTLPGGAYSYTMTVPGLLVNDNLKIECVLYYVGVTPVSSEPAYLRVQGKLDAVGDVILEQHNNTTLRLGFTAPFTLLGVPIKFYTIQITSADLHTNNTRMISGTELLYEPPDVCTSYSFIIAAWNAVGKGENTSVNGTLYKAPQKVNISSTTVRFLSATIITVTAEFTVDTQCTGRIPKNISVRLNNTDTLETISSPSCPLWKYTVDCENRVFISHTNTQLSISVNLTEYLETHNHYTATVALENTGGETKSNNFDFSTFHVQNISMTKIRNHHCVTCMFALGSTASGCLIRFMDATLADREIKTADAHRLSPDSPSAYICEEGKLPPGLYRVLASDISTSGTVDDRVAAVGSSLITIPEMATLTTPRSSSSYMPSASPTTVISVIPSSQQRSKSPTVMISVATTGLRAGSADPVLLVPLIAAVSGISILAACIIVLMVACLIYFRTEARKHKIAELDAKSTQKELEICKGEPLYDEINQTGHVIVVQQCPAYAPLPPPRS